jgi:hypothetical protein
MEETTHGASHAASQQRQARPDIPDAGMDLDPSRRPGVPRMRAPQPLPNTRFPPSRQESDVKVFMHGRANKSFPPVFGTDVPPRALSGSAGRPTPRCAGAGAKRAAAAPPQRPLRPTPTLPRARPARRAPGASRA